MSALITVVVRAHHVVHPCVRPRVHASHVVCVFIISVFCTSDAHDDELSRRRYARHFDGSGLV